MNRNSNQTIPVCVYSQRCQFAACLRTVRMILWVANQSTQGFRTESTGRRPTRSFSFTGFKYRQFEQMSEEACRAKVPLRSPREMHVSVGLVIRKFR